MQGKMTLSAPPKTPPVRRGGEVTAANIFDRVLNFPGAQPEFAALLLGSAFSSGLLSQGAVFIWNGPARPIAIESSLPEIAPEAAPAWFESILDFMAKDSPPTQTKVFPPVGDAEGIRSRGGLLVPLSPADNAYAAFEMGDIQPAAMSALMQNMEFISSLWRFYQVRRNADATEAFVPAMAVLATVNRATRFQQFAMSLCNEMASRFGCDRVSLGFVKGRYVRMSAMSHTEKFGKGMNLVRAIESAMEECVDQDSETMYPEPRGFTGVSRAAAELARQFGSGCVISIPLRHENRTEGALILELSPSDPPDPRDLKLLRLVGELVAPRLLELRRHDCWVGARLADYGRRRLEGVLGPTHTLAKLAAIACVAAIAWLAVARGDYKVDATFVAQPVEQRIVAAPFDGFVTAVHVRPGEELVAAETLMMELETSELRSLLAMRRAEQRSHEKDASLARRDNKMAESQVAEAKAEQAAAECDLLEERIRQAKIFAPLTGVTLSGDWTKKIGAPLKQGDPLFEVAPIEDMEADLYVPEDDISDVKVGQEGELAPAGRPDEKIRFRVIRVTPMAELVKQKNVFRVQVKLVSPPPWLRPGIEGVAKIDVDRRLLLDIWTRKAINWARMKLWW